MKVIGLSGKMGSGTTTTARLLTPHAEGVVIMSFADVLRSAVSLLFDVDDLDLRYNKNILVEGIGITPRQLLQRVGLFARELDSCVLTRCMRRRVETVMRYGWVKVVVIDDVRMVDEAEWIHDECGGKVVRLLRGSDVVSANGVQAKVDEFGIEVTRHDTETALDDWHGFDLVVDNRTMGPEETAALVAEKCLY
jgi:hypothetical protein